MIHVKNLMVSSAEPKSNQVATAGMPTLERMFDCVLRTDLAGEIAYVSPRGRDWLEKISRTSMPDNLCQLFQLADQGRIAAQLHSEEERSLGTLQSADGADVPVAMRRMKLIDGKQFLFCLLETPGPGLAGGGSHRDDLTALPTRPAIVLEIDRRLGRSETFWFALFNIDKFRLINESFGVAVADALLVEAAKRLKAIMPADTWLGRLGADEFACLWGGSEAELQQHLDEVLLEFARPFVIDGKRLYMCATIGVSSSTDGQSPGAGSLLANADTALIAAKASGGSCWKRYAERRAGLDYSLVSAIYNGIENGEFFLVYQPQFGIDGRLYGAEALMRWSSYDRGFVSPGQFIPVAEQFGIISFLGRWALRVACHHLKQILPSHPGFLMSVNVAASQFGAPDFADQVMAAVQEADVPPSSLVLEITESTLMHNSERTEAALASLRAAGIRFSIDDFGTGFSSLAYLTRFPVSAIKIDKSFIDPVGSGEAAPDRLVQAMINLAHSIDLKVVAEGVETETQRQFLALSHCDILQGYLTGRPIAFDQLLNLDVR